MINKIPYFLFRITTGILLILSFFSCSESEHYTFEKQLFETENYIDCSAVNCAIMEIRLIQILNDTEVADRINSILEKKACEFLMMEENAPITSIETAMQSFNKLYIDILEAFPNETPRYEALLDSEVQYQNEHLASFLINTYSFTGGAHGNTATTLLNFDLSTGSLIPLDSLLKDKTAFLRYAEEKFKSAYNIPSHNRINSTGFSFDKDRFSLSENIGFTDKEIILYYNNYEISSYADGPVVLKLDKTEAAGYFNVNILD